MPKKTLDEGYVKFHYTHQQAAPLPAKLLTAINKTRAELYKLKLIGAYPNKVGYGNISIRHQDGLSSRSGGFIISGTETGNFKKLTAKHYTFVKNWNFAKNHLTCAGPIVASSESLTHAAVYESAKTAGAVIHVHNLKLWKRLLNKIPTTHKNVPYGTPAMAKEIKRLFKETELKNKKILVMAGHREGIMVFGKNLNEAKKILLNYYQN